jgi:hypothetical protein
MNTRHVAVGLFLLALLIGPALGQEKAAIRWKLEKDKTFYQTVVHGVKQEMTVSGQKIGMANEQTMELAWTPLKQLTDKSWVVQMKFLAIKRETTVGDKKVVFDSSNPGEAGKEIAAKIKPLLESSFTFTLSPQMKATKVEGYKEVLTKIGKGDTKLKQFVETLFTPDSLKQIADETFAMVPPKPVAKGDTWTLEHKVPLGAMGAFNTKSVYTLEGQSDGIDKIKVETTYGKHEPPGVTAGALPFKFKKFDLKASKSTGTILFNTKTGRVESTSQEAKVEGRVIADANGKELDIDLVQDRKETSKTSDENPVKK